MYRPLRHERNDKKLSQNSLELREKVTEELERVKALVPIKEWVGDRFNGYNLVTVDKHKDIETIADCLQAIVDFMDTFTESEGK